MTTTQTISRERLEEIIGVINAGAYGYSISAEEIGSMARMLLAALDSKPVATLDIQSGRPDGKKFALVYSSAAHKLPDDVYYLHAAPPAPVAVPDSRKIFEAAIDLCRKDDSIDEHAWNHGVLNVMMHFENACRAAMLKGDKS